MIGIDLKSNGVHAPMHQRWIGVCMSLIGVVAAVCAMTYYTRGERLRGASSDGVDDEDSGKLQNVNQDDTELAGRQTSHTGGTGIYVKDGARASEPVSELPLKPEDAERAKVLLQALKGKANRAFQEMRLEDAMHGYQSCLDIISTLGRADSNIETTRNVIHANVIMTLLKLHEYESASHVATMLLQDSTTVLSPDLTVKVLFRRGLASKGLGHIDAALSDLQAALQLSPNQRNPAAEREISLINRAR